MRNFIMAIDGPAGSGKSTIAKILAERHNLTYLDTGAMYRMVALYFFENNVDLDNDLEVKLNLANIKMDIEKDRFILNGKDMIMKQTINDKTIKELEEIFLNLGFQKFRAKQVFRQIHVNKINDFSKMTDLSKDMREKLDQIFYFPKIKILKEFKSNLDKTKKYLFELDDKNIIEAVFMEYNNRNTICISSQVGCKMGCKFCASTKNGHENRSSHGRQ